MELPRLWRKQMSEEIGSGKIEKWTTLSSKIAFDNPWYRLRQDAVKLPNGVTVDDYFVALRPDIATILPVTANDEVVMVRQYRHGVGEILLELPAGTFEVGEEPLAVAKRELLEETGYASGDWREIATFYNSPVKQNNRVYLFKAQAAQRVSEQKLDVTEDIEVVLKPIAELPALVASGEICVAGTITALALGFPGLF